MNETRTEIMEERGNRDAFHLAIMIAILFALFLGVLGIAAWNSRIMLMPLVPFSPRAEKTGEQRTENRGQTMHRPADLRAPTADLYPPTSVLCPLSSAFAPAHSSSHPARLTHATRLSDVSLGSWRSGQGIFSANLRGMNTAAVVSGCLVKPRRAVLFPRAGKTA